MLGINGSTKFEHAILTWVLAPLVLISLLIALFNIKIDRGRCQSICANKEYAGFRYHPKSRSAPKGQCHCLTDEEVKLKNRVPKGNRVF